jgi:hypothetical protein
MMKSNINESNNPSPFCIKELDRISWSGVVKIEKKISNAKIYR